MTLAVVLSIVYAAMSLSVLFGTKKKEVKQTVAEEAAHNGSDTKLEILEAISGGAKFRYEKRREYEWKLGLAIWTAIAAFIALIVNEDFGLRGGGIAVWVGICGALITAAHAYYLHGMIKCTLDDVRVMNAVEDSMIAHFNSKAMEELQIAVHFRSPPSWYGMAQVIITLILVVAAVAAVYYRAPVLASPAPDCCFHLKPV